MSETAKSRNKKGISRRPFIGARIDELERMLDNSAGSLQCLTQLQRELEHRTTIRAKRLKQRVATEAQRLKRAPPQPITSAAATPAGFRFQPPEKNEERVATLTPALPLELSIPLECLSLSTRAQKLVASRRMTYVGDLTPVAPGKILKFRSVGRRTVDELTNVLGQLGLEAGRTYPGWDKEVARRCESDAAKLAVRLQRPAPPPKELRAALLEDLRSVEPSDRNFQMIAAQLGFDGNGGSTLVEAAAPYSLTRERARQVVARAGKRLRARRMVPEVLSRAVALTLKNLPITEHDLASVLWTAGIDKEEFQPAGVINAARFYGLAMACEWLQLGTHRLLIRPGTGPNLRALSTQAAKMSGSRGCVQLDNLVSDTPEFDSEEGRNAVAVVLAQRDGFEWLDKDGGWFWFKRPPNSRRNRLVNTIKRVLSVAPCITLAELRASIRRNYRLGGFAPPTYVLRLICDRIPFATLDGNTLKRTDASCDWSAILADTEEKLVNILHTNGPVIARHLLVELCKNAGLSDAWILVATSYSIIMWRPASGYYALVGATIPPGTIEAQLRQRPKHGLGVQADGWLPGGDIYISWRLTASKISSGIFSIRNNFKDFLQGRFELFSTAGEMYNQIQVINSTCWNLSKCLRRFGAEPDEILALRFSLSSRRVVGAVGGEEISQLIEDGRAEEIFDVRAMEVSSSEGEDDDDVTDSDQ